MKITWLVGVVDLEHQGRDQVVTTNPALCHEAAHVAVAELHDQTPNVRFGS